MGATSIGLPLARGPAASGDILDALTGVAATLGAETDPDELLSRLAERACTVLGVRRCAIYMRDRPRDPFRGRVAYPARRRDADEWMSRSVAGTAADRFTQEILATRRPVLIPDARRDPRCVRRAMVRWNIRSMLGVPMIVDGEVMGLLFLDNGDAPYDYSPEMQRVAAGLADLGAVTLTRVRELASLRRSADTAARQNRLLRRAMAVEDRLGRQRSIDDLAVTLARIVGNPCAVYDRELRALTHDDDVPTASLTRIGSSASDLRAGEPTFTGPFPDLGLHRRLLVSLAETGDYVVVLERGRELTVLDVIATRRATTAAATLLRARRHAARAERYSRDSLVRDLLHGADDEASLLRRARFHGLDLTRPHVVCGLSVGLDDVERIWPALWDRVEPLFGVEDDAGVLLLLPAASRAEAGQRAAALAQASGATAVVSFRCRRIGAYPAAAEQCRPLTRRDGVRVSDGEMVHEPGLGGLLRAPAVSASAEAFAQDIAGELLGSPELFATLAIFFETRRNTRKTGQRLGIHENTVRHRLRKASRVTGLDLGSSADDLLAAELAVSVLGGLGSLGPAGSGT